MIPERRQRRSDNPATAARLYLTALARRRAHRSVALADRDGLLIAGSEGTVDAEAVAAVAPLYGDASPGEQDGLLALITRGATLSVWDLDLDGAPCFLAAVGGPSAPPTEAWHDLGRILG